MLDQPGGALGKVGDWCLRLRAADDPHQLRRPLRTPQTPYSKDQGVTFLGYWVTAWADPFRCADDVFDTYEEALAAVPALGAVAAVCDMTFLDISFDGALEVEHEGAKHKFRTYDAFISWCEANAVASVSCSSSLDFPEDYTDDSGVIEACRLLRTY